MVNKPKVVRLIFFLIAFALVLLHAFNILRFEASGDYKVYKFKIDLRDPYDPVRGRYLYLYFAPSKIFLSEKDDEIALGYHARRCWIAFENDKDGFAYPSRILKNPQEDFCIKADGFFSTDTDANGVSRRCYNLRLPFRKYFINEKLAPKAEKLIAKLPETSNVVLAVKVYRGGMFSVEDLLIDDKPIREIIAER
jgi:hypothetical protein